MSWQPYRHRPIGEMEVEIEQLRSIIARSEKAVLNYYLLTGGQFGSELIAMRKVLGLPVEISDDERAATAGRWIAGPHTGGES